MRLRFYLSLIIGDILALLAAFMLAGLIYTGVLFEPRAMMQAQLILPLFLTIALYNRTYSIIALIDLRKSITNMIAALVVSAVLLNFFAFFAKSNAQFSRATFTIGLILTAVMMVASRIGLRRWMQERGGPSIENVLIIEDGGPEVPLPHAYALMRPRAPCRPQ